MTDVARLTARSCAAVGALGLVLIGGPAWALDLPSLPSAPAAPLPSGVPAPVASLLPSPVASTLEPVLSQLPDSAPSAQPSPSPSPKPKPAPAPPPTRQVARGETRIAAIPATIALRGGSDTAALRALPGIVAPMAAAPMPVVPQLAPAATTSMPQSLPSSPGHDGLPALVVALAIGTVSAAAAGQVAAMAERRRPT